MASVTQIYYHTKPCRFKILEIIFLFFNLSNYDFTSVLMKSVYFVFYHI